jgi:predicted molibdopterin-dependent oxidoreductase YjgC
MSIRSRSFAMEERISVSINGRYVSACPGDTVLTVLLLENECLLAGTLSRPRGAFCNMGVCFDCVVEVASEQSDQWRPARACQTLAEKGLQIRTIIEG